MKPKRIQVAFIEQPILEIGPECVPGNADDESSARRERIIATARRIFEATAAEQYMDSQIRSAFVCAEGFEDAADKYRNGVKS